MKREIRFVNNSMVLQRLGEGHLHTRGERITRLWPTSYTLSTVLVFKTEMGKKAMRNGRTSDLRVDVLSECFQIRERISLFDSLFSKIFAQRLNRTYL